MMYNFRNIPALIFFDIYENDNIELLGYKTKEENREQWEKINTEYEKRVDSKQKKIIELFSKIRFLETKLILCENAIMVLKHSKDEEVIQILKDFRYNIKAKTLQKDLDKVENKIKSIPIQIDNYKLRLEKILPKNDSKEFDFSKQYMAMCLILETTPKNSNEVLLCDYINLIEFSEQRAKSLEKLKS